MKKGRGKPSPYKIINESRGKPSPYEKE